MRAQRPKFAKKVEWYLWARYGQGHVRYVDIKKLSEKDAKKWAQQQLEKLMKTNTISECYISTGTGDSYRQVKIYKNFYWIKPKNKVC